VPTSNPICWGAAYLAVLSPEVGCCHWAIFFYSFVIWTGAGSFRR